MNFSFVFPATFTPDPDGGFVITFRDLPEAITQGETQSQCLNEAADCLAEALAARIDDNQDIPVPTVVQVGEYPVSVPLDIACKAKVYEAMRKANVTVLDLAATLGVKQDRVRKLLAPSYAVDQSFAEQTLKALL